MTHNDRVNRLSRLAWERQPDCKLWAAPDGPRFVAPPTGWTGGYRAGVENIAEHPRETLWTGYRAGCPELEGSATHKVWIRGYEAGESDRNVIRKYLEVQP